MSHRLTFNQYLILAFVSVSVPLGDASLSRGMTSLPPISVAHPLIADRRGVYAVDCAGHCAADRIFSRAT